jgi:hypothetical protein
MPQLYAFTTITSSYSAQICWWNLLHIEANNMSKQFKKNLNDTNLRNQMNQLMASATIIIDWSRSISNN